jgi:hypothetical protein
LKNSVTRENANRSTRLGLTMIQEHLVKFEIDEALENLPFSERVSDSAEFVYLFQRYSLSTGANFLIWTRGFDGTCERYIFATGSLAVKFDHQKHKVDDPSLSRIQRAEATVKAALAALDSDPFEDMLRKATPLIDESKIISTEEFDRVLRLNAEFKTGSRYLLGFATAERVVSRSEDGMSDAATWIGGGMTDSAWDAINELLDVGGFRQLPHREYLAATGKFVES